MPRARQQPTADTSLALTALAALVPWGAIVYCVITHVARSGMSRQIKFLVAQASDKPGEPPVVVNICPQIADLFGYRWNDDGSVTVGGCGMDIAAHVVMNLGGKLFPDGGPAPYAPDTHVAGAYCIRYQHL